VGNPDLTAGRRERYGGTALSLSAYASYVVETLLVLVAVSGLAFVVLYGAKRAGLGRAHGPIALVGRLSLDARRAIYLVRIGKPVIVVGAAETGLTKLGETSTEQLDVRDTPNAPSSTSAPLAFAQALARVRGKRGRAQPIPLGTIAETGAARQKFRRGHCSSGTSESPLGDSGVRGEAPNESYDVPPGVAGREADGETPAGVSPRGTSDARDEPAS
jgi:flagellar biogenesis protein FliO